MTASLLYNALTARGLTLSCDGDTLNVSPALKITPADAAAIRQHKPELLRLLDSPIARPHLTAEGELRIGFGSHPRFHWWRPGGQSALKTLLELNAPPATVRLYASRSDAPLHTASGVQGCKGDVVDLGEVSLCVGCGWYVENIC